jgi:DNA polymerase-4
LLVKLSERLANRVEKDKKSINKLQVKLKFDDFVLKTKEFQFTHLDLDIYLQMLRELASLRPERKIRLIGIGVGYGEEAQEQMALFA